ncbi:hypothetical protein CLAVI_000946 [Candidatus Clavichlamydia salmonicola]|uniref:hypothetical protein n=1 Tax=Candidatus Clavichlamydia salmonicola TaxID=469812 RepID=UPI001891400A|nr:hypothetical protein [Candidatus Clavichlamydia salmonicola]MBF5051305.1 hypothetical protein [Candidatus Clavichlamydia salmonicola]
MSGISDGFSAGIESLNNNVLVYTARKCPTSWSELKTNVSKNIRACAKASTAFLSSSLGMSFVMGTFGIIVASVCAREHVDVFLVAIAQKVDHSVSLCFSRSHQNLTQNSSFLASWNIPSLKVCMGKIVGNSTMYCSALDHHHHFDHEVSLPVCNSTMKGIGDKITEYVVMKFMHKAHVSVKNVTCLSNHTMFANVQSGENDQENRFRNNTMCLSGTTRNHMPVYCWEGIDDSNQCKSLVLFFSAESIVVLTATVGSIIYNQCKVTVSKKSYKSLISLVPLTLSNALQLTASALGAKIFLNFFMSPCDPIDAGSNRVIISSTALYWASAASRLVDYCITSPFLEEPMLEEAIRLEECQNLPEGDDDEDEEGLINQVFIV